MVTTQSKSPSFFNFLKEGLLLPIHNRRLFTAVFVIIVASRYLLGNDLAVQPLTDDEVGIDISKSPLNSTDTGSREFHHLVHQIMDDTRNLFFTGVVDRLVSKTIGSVTEITILFAAMATYSGELLTVASLLGKGKAKLKGPLLTVAFVYVLEIAYTALLMAMAAILAFIMSKQYGTFLFRAVLLVIGMLMLVIFTFFFLVYFSFVCSLSVVMAVAEPGCHGASAVGRAWRLMKGKLLRAML